MRDERRNLKCEGWKNWDTWAVVVNLENNFESYNLIRNSKKNWSNLEDFKRKYAHYVADRVNWSYVSAKELKEWYNDLRNAK